MNCSTCGRPFKYYDRPDMKKCHNQDEEACEAYAAGKTQMRELCDMLATGLKWALRNIEQDSGSWTCEEDSIAHQAAEKALAEDLAANPPVLVNRMHEECLNCFFVDVEPPICKGHLEGPVDCNDFIPAIHPVRKEKCQKCGRECHGTLADHDCYEERLIDEELARG